MVNSKNIDDIEKILRRGIADRDSLYRVLNESLVKTGRVQPRHFIVKIPGQPVCLMKKPTEYTCADYRAEMILLSLKRRLYLEDLNPEDKNDILLKIRELEASMEFK